MPSITNSDTNNAPLEFSPISECITSFAAGEFLIVLDSPSRENEGDLIIAASALTPSKAAFMIHHSSGYLCAPLSPERAQHLNLPAMVPLGSNADPNRTAYTITVDATGRGVTTGISATDRAATCNVLGDAGTRVDDLRRPGHVVPLIARKGGVRERRGHTEAGWELARLAGLKPEVAVIGEIVEEVAPRSDGRAEYEGAVGMMRAEGCLEFGKKWGIKCCTIEDLVAYVEEKEGKLVEKEKTNGGA